MAKTKKVLWGRVVAFLGMLLMAFVVVLFTTNLIPSTTLIRSILSPRAAAAPKPINVLQINYIPTNQVARRQQIIDRSTALAADLAKGSTFHGYKVTTALPFSQVVIKATVERDVPAPYTTGTYETWYESLNTILTQDKDAPGGMNLCDYIVANNIDQVWGWFDVSQQPPGGFNQEYVRFFSRDVDPMEPYPPLCNGRRSFTVLGLDQDAPVGNAMESYNHSMESLLEKVWGEPFFYTNFMGGPNTMSISRICGNAHFPPNGGMGAGLGYDFTNTTNVTSTCENWKPDGTGATSTFNCGRWACNEEGYQTWWLQNLPNANSGLTYQGRPMANIWDLASDTDNAIANAAAQGQFMSPLYLDHTRTSYLTAVAKNYQQSGASLTVTPSVTGTNTLLMVSAAYYSPQDTATDATNSQQITSLTLTNSAGTKTITTALGRVLRTTSAGYETELWYVKAPPAGTNTVVVNFANGVTDQNVSATVLNGVNQATPFATTTGYSAGMWNATPTLAIPSTSAQLLFGVMSTYRNSTNEMTVTGETRGTWGMWTLNAIGKGAITSGGPNAALTWSSTKNQSWPWSISAVAINMISTLPTPSPTPTTPKATTFTINGPTSGTTSATFTVTPVGGPYTGTITFTPSGTGATGLTAKTLTFSNSQVAQTFMITPTVAGLITLTPSNNGGLTNPAAFSYTSVIPSTPPPTATTGYPTLDLKMNNGDIFFNDTSIKTLLAQKYTLSWTSTNATSCSIAYGDWLGAVVKQPTSGSVSLGTGASTIIWAMTCTGPTGTATDVTRVVPIRSVKSLIPTVALFANHVDTTAYNGVVHPLIVKPGTILTLTWSVSGATSCTASGGWTGVKSITGGSLQLGGATASKTYTITCKNGTYSAVSSVQVTVK